MFTKNIPVQLLIIAVLFSGLFCIVGCVQSQQRTVDPDMVVAPATEEITPPVAQQAPVNRDDAVSMYVDAMMLNDLNEREEAIRKLNYALDLDPTFALAYSLKGDILQGMEKYEDSANAYEQATVHDPWSFKDFLNLGKVCQIIKQWARAATAYASACKIEPDHYPAHIGAAQCYFEANDYDSSLTFAEKAKALEPGKADPELLLGDLFTAKKDNAQAINAYRRALEMEGNNPSVMVSLARTYLRSGQYSAAIELLTGAIAMDPQYSLAYQYLGFAQLRMKENDKAIQSYQQAVQADENDWMAHKGLGVAYMLTAMKTQGPDQERTQALAVEQWNISLMIKPDQPKLRQLVQRHQ